jgi:hypothetical protein
LGLFLDIYLAYVFRAVVYVFKAVAHWLGSRKSEQWPLANATITAPPLEPPGHSRTVELVYSYRFHGELYTGLHEEPFLLKDSMADYITRFAIGNSIVVRVNAHEPEISVVYEEDQDKLVPEPASL